MLPQEDKDRINNFVLDNALAFPNYGTSNLKKIVDAAVGTTPPTGAKVREDLGKLSGTEKTTYADLILMLKEIVPGVDEEIVQNRISVRGFNSRPNAPLVATKTSLNTVQNVTRHCCRFMEYVALANTQTKNPFKALHKLVQGARDESKHAAAIYKKWFDDGINVNRLAKVRTIFTKVLDAVCKKRFEVVCDADLTTHTGVCACAADWWGAAIPGESLYRFYICELSFNSAPIVYDLDPNNTGVGCKTYQATQVDNIVVTIIHELTHLPMIGKTADEEPDPYDVATMQDRAKNNPDKSCNNADNYAYFALEVMDWFG